MDALYSQNISIHISRGQEPQVASIYFIGQCGSRGACLVGLVVKNPPANARDIRDGGSIPGLGRSPLGGCGSTLQYSCLENPMDRGAWWVTVRARGCKELDKTEAT